LSTFEISSLFHTDVIQWENLDHYNSESFQLFGLLMLIMLPQNLAKLEFIVEPNTSRPIFPKKRLVVQPGSEHPEGVSLGFT
jgi:hypothetical protein